MKGGEGIRKHRGEESYGCSLRVDYNEFKNGNEQTRKLLIYQAIFTTFDMSIFYRCLTYLSAIVLSKTNKAQLKLHP
jgi:hypothetical protein